MSDILLLHGPNLNLLGTREPGVYGACTLEEINHRALEQCDAVGARLETLQSNSECELAYSCGVYERRSKCSPQN